MCLVDVIMMSMLAADYNKISNDISAYIFVSAVGVMMTIAAKGFAVLVANLVFSVSLFLLSKNADANVS